MCTYNKNHTVKCVNCGQGHATTSRLCLKELEAYKKATFAHTSTKKAYNQTGQHKSIPIPLTDAWATLTVHEVENDHFQGHHQSTNHNHRETNESNHQTTKLNTTTMQNRKSGPKVVSTPTTNINAWTNPFVSSMEEFPISMSANRTKRSFSGKSANQ